MERHILLVFKVGDSESMVHCLIVKYVHHVSLHCLPLPVEIYISLFHGFKLGHITCFGHMICHFSGEEFMVSMGLSIHLFFVCHEAKDICSSASGTKSHLAYNRYVNQMEKLSLL